MSEADAAYQQGYDRGFARGARESDDALAAAYARGRAEGRAEEAWRCFHCGEIFTDRSEAEAHFGVERGESWPTPACRIDAAELTRLRQIEQDNEDLRVENDKLQDFERLWHEANADRERRIGHRAWWQELDYREGERLVLSEKLAAAEATIRDLHGRSEAHAVTPTEEPS